MESLHIYVDSSNYRSSYISMTIIAQSAQEFHCLKDSTLGHSKLLNLNSKQENHCVITVIIRDATRQRHSDYWLRQDQQLVTQLVCSQYT